MADNKSHYETLGVSENASQGEIRKAYMQQAKQWHPDKNPDNKEEATKKFMEINNANETLSDPNKRAEYDAQQREQKSSSQQNAKPAEQKPPQQQEQNAQQTPPQQQQGQKAQQTPPQQQQEQKAQQTPPQQQQEQKAKPQQQAGTQPQQNAQPQQQAGAQEQKPATAQAQPKTESAPQSAGSKPKASGGEGGGASKPVTGDPMLDLILKLLRDMMGGSQGNNMSGPGNSMPGGNQFPMNQIQQLITSALSGNFMNPSQQPAKENAAANKEKVNTEPQQPEKGEKTKADAKPENNDKEKKDAKENQDPKAKPQNKENGKAATGPASTQKMSTDSKALTASSQNKQAPSQAQQAPNNQTNQKMSMSNQKMDAGGGGGGGVKVQPAKSNTGSKGPKN